MDEQVSDFNELCRICASKTDLSIRINIFNNNDQQISNRINSCLPVQILETDHLPNIICTECDYKLISYFTFRNKSLETEQLLINLWNAMNESEISTNNKYKGDESKLVMDLVIQDSEKSMLNTVDIIDHSEIMFNDTNELNVREQYLVDGQQELDLGDFMNNSEQSCPEGNLKLEIKSQHTSDLSDSDEYSDEDFSATLETVNCEVEKNENVFVEEAHKFAFLNSIKTDSSETADTIQYLCVNDYEEHLCKCISCEMFFPNSDELWAHRNEMHSHQNEKSDETETNETHNSVEYEQKNNNSDDDEEYEDEYVEVIEEEEEDENEEKEKRSKQIESKICPDCGKSFKTNYKLQEHMRKHSNEKPYKCSMCDKGFRSKIGLAQHEAKHTGQFDYACSTCGKGFQCKSYLIVHQRVHSNLKPYPCTTCDRNFKTKQALLDHQNRHLGVKPYLCDICGRGFITKGLCKSHQKVHSGTDNRQYPCHVCNKLFVSKSYLATHVRIHTGDKPFMCEVCGKGFLTRVDLRIHSTLHTGEKSFVCEMCGKAFARRDALRCHRRSHTGERPYSCDICGQTFTQFSPMAIHKRLHTGERPYSCDVCNKSFVSRSTMMSHRKKHVP